MKRNRHPSTLYFVLVKHDDGRIDEWKSAKSLKEAEMKKAEMEETRGYERFTIEVRPIPALDAADFIKKIESQIKKNG